MDWIHQYQLFLFDFDGLLVDTEELHFKAYKKICKERGFFLPWDMKTYARFAMHSATGLKAAIYQTFPKLFEEEPNWEILYGEKKKAYCELLHTEGVGLMPGAENLLAALEKANRKRCVVTHSPKSQTAIIRKQHPILNTIPHWITREDYKDPKPASECYEKAISLYGDPNDKIIGFEDSPRGLKALASTKAKAVFISSFFNQNEIRSLQEEIRNVFFSFSSLEMISG